MERIIVPGEQGRWYDSTGQIVREVDGKEPTLREARKLNLYGSVTSILKVKSKPGLDAWIREQLLLSALTLQPLPGEPLETFAKRIAEDSKEEGVQAADRGTLIHYVATLYLMRTGRLDDVLLENPEVKPYLDRFSDWWNAEPRTLLGADYAFGSRRGYAGTVDLIYRDVQNRVVVADIKTRRVQGKKIPRYIEDGYQLAAYATAITEEKMPVDLIKNVYICTNADLPVEEEDWTEKSAELFLGFEACATLWRQEKNYWPTQGGGG